MKIWLILSACSLSRLEDGSSAIIISGSFISARAITVRRFSPTERVPGKLSDSFSSPSWTRSSLARKIVWRASDFEPSVKKNGRRTLSRTFSDGIRLYSCETKPIFLFLSFEISSSENSAISVPFQKTLPENGFWIPAAILMSCFLRRCVRFRSARKFLKCL